MKENPSSERATYPCGPRTSIWMISACQVRSFGLLGEAGTRAALGIAVRLPPCASLAVVSSVDPASWGRSRMRLILIPGSPALSNPCSGSEIGLGGRQMAPLEDGVGEEQGRGIGGSQWWHNRPAHAADSMLGSAQELGGSATRNMYVLFVLLFVEKHGDGAVY